METAIATALIAFLGSLMGAVLTYWFTKQREREAEWRKEKLAHYKAFIESVSGTIEGDSSPEGQKSFAKATNNLLLFAPQSVIAALNEFRHEIRVSNMNCCSPAGDTS
jgi:membrane protein YqaA with SNARE-associated domain